PPDPPDGEAVGGGPLDGGPTESTEKITRQVFVTDSGNVLVATNLVTLKVLREFSQEKAEQVIKGDDLKIGRRLCFGQKLYKVQVSSNASLPDTIESLKSPGHYIWVEPSLLQTLKPKEALIPKDPEFKKQWHHLNTGLDKDGLPLGKAGEDLDSTKAWV